MPVEPWAMAWCALAWPWSRLAPVAWCWPTPVPAGRYLRSRATSAYLLIMNIDAVQQWATDALLLAVLANQCETAEKI